MRLTLSHSLLLIRSLISVKLGRKGRKKQTRETNHMTEETTEYLKTTALAVNELSH